MKLDLADLKYLFLHPLLIKIFCMVLSLAIIYEIVCGITMDLMIHKLTVLPMTRKISTTTTSVFPQNLRGDLFGPFADNNLHNIGTSLLKIGLVGLVFSNNAQESEVIVHTASGRDRVYRIGDEISSGVHIEKITKNGMIINRDGHLESILLPKIE